MVQLDRLLTWSNPIERKSDPYKKRSPTVVRIVERRGGICCCKILFFIGNSKYFLQNLLVKYGF